MVALNASGAGAAETDYELSLNIEGFATVNSINEDSPFNRDNRFARLENWRYDTLFQPRLMVGYGGFSAIALPRLLVTVSETEGTVSDQADPYFQEFNFGYTGEHLSTNLGRELLYWGPAINQSPSNPFYAAVNQINPFIEPRARDLARVRYAFNDAFSLSFIANYGLGRDDITLEYPEFENIYAAKADYVGKDFSVGGLYANRDGASWLGVFGQWTVSDAMVAYVDGAVRQGSEALAAQRDPTLPIGWNFVRAHDDDTWLADVLVGASYTFFDGGTATLEYRYNQQGYEGSQLDDYNALVTAAAQAVTTDPAAAPLLAQAPNTFIRTLGRNYLNVQYLKRDAFIDDLSLNVILQWNLDDGGAQLISIANYYLASRWRLSAYVVTNFGGADTEFGRFLDNSAFLGVTWFSGPLTKH